MKKVSILFVIISSFFIFSCERKIEVRTTPELTQIFNTQEIENISTIVSFYEDRLKKQTNSDQIDSAFYKFAKQNVNQLQYDMSGFDKESLERLYSHIDSQIYDKIWEENKGFNYEINDSISFQNIAFEKKFMNYLDLIGDKNPKIKYVHDKIASLGMVQGILVNTLYQDFDEEGRNGKISTNIGDFNNRVIVAIFTITIADNICRDKMIQQQKLEMQQSEKAK
ncbi:hypothetical protein KORDIASMS9_02324 [Kordia sp. SMS9]|uniref:hypothetical protein n=1 Tax=Kordia sp. SMS9 TaxID=2282170 RepID=UPI000E10991A|nr:hypothetical protein [Kordia sp. SMS9]AXG70095.1 hypothetical protein KORDIASMS9_02324 [Kordia sp. SMS9]